MKGKVSREMLLSVGLDLMSVRGVSGVTLGQLATGSAMSKSGLFAHFRSKEQLQIDLLDKMAEVADCVVVVPAMQEPRGFPRFKTLVNLWFGWPHRAGLSGGCPIAAALFELDDLEGGVRAHAQKLEARWRDLLEQLVREAIEEGHLSAETDVKQSVWELLGIYLSHHVSSRFLRDEDASSRAERAFAGLVKRMQPQNIPIHLQKKA
jgi:AcrR family transcriptional regulator